MSIAGLPLSPPAASTNPVDKSTIWKKLRAVVIDPVVASQVRLRGLYNSDKARLAECVCSTRRKKLKGLGCSYTQDSVMSPCCAKHLSVCLFRAMCNQKVLMLLKHEKHER